MPDVSIDVAHLLGWAIGMSFYGFYVGLFAITMWVLRNHQHNRGIVYWAIVLLFAISTTQICICSAESYDAWIRNRGGDGPGAFFLEDGNKWQPIKDTFVYLGNVVADACVCWRLYVVWSHNKWVLVAPVLLLTVSTVSGALVVFYEARTVMVNDDRYLVTSSNLTILVIVCTLCVNILTTSLIAGRLWWINRQVQVALSNRRSARLQRVIVALIESGALYTATMLTLIILYGAAYINTVYLMAYIVPMVIGIFPTLIVLQVNISTHLFNSATTIGPSSNTNVNVRTANDSSNAIPFKSASSGTLGASKTRLDDGVQIQVDVQQHSKSSEAGAAAVGKKNKKKSLLSLNATSSVPERRHLAHRKSSLDLSLSSDDGKDEDSKGARSSEGFVAPQLTETQMKSKPMWVSRLGKDSSDIQADLEMAPVNHSGKS